MILKSWDALPNNIKSEEVKPYYYSLYDKRMELLVKRLFDIVASFVMLILLFPFFIVISIAIVFDSKGPIFYRQERVTQYGRVFKIYKFRSMIQDADKGSLITFSNDNRITKFGKFLRDSKIDELPQLINVFIGDMTFVGTRPEVKKYVKEYSNEMKATLLLPAGITSLASIYFSGENEMIKDTQNIDDIYINTILPEKMKWNLRGITKFSLLNDIRIMLMTVFTVFRNFIKI